MKAIIPAAGLGTRLLPATKSMPKEMLPVLGKPVIQYVVEEAVASGIEDILIVTGRGKRIIEDHFDQSFELEHHLRSQGKGDALEAVQSVADLADIHYVRQKEPLGLGHAILCAERFVGNESFAVLLGDDILLDAVPPTQQLMELHEETGLSVFSAMRVPHDEISRYGSVKGSPHDRIAGAFMVDDIVEKPEPAVAPSNLATMGRYVFTPRLFDHLRNCGPSVGNEIQLADGMAALAHEQALLAYEFLGDRLDVGSLSGFIEANVRMAMKQPDLRDVVVRATTHEDPQAKPRLVRP